MEEAAADSAAAPEAEAEAEEAAEDADREYIYGSEKINFFSGFIVLLSKKMTEKSVKTTKTPNIFPTSLLWRLVMILY